MEDDRLDPTEVGMHLVFERTQEMLFALAGEPVGFALVVSDGKEVATSTNLTGELAVQLLRLAIEGALARLDDEARTRTKGEPR